MIYLNEINVPTFEFWKQGFVNSNRHAEFIDLCNKWAVRFKNISRLNPNAKSNLRDRFILNVDGLHGSVGVGDNMHSHNLYTIFWYDWILNHVNYDDLVLDIGCGNHMFKPFYHKHNIIGADKGNFKCDIQAHLRDLDEYKGKLKTAFCFNSIHHTEDEGLHSNLEYLSSLLQPFCLAVVTVNNNQINIRRKNYEELIKNSVDRIYNTISKSETYDLVYFESKTEYCRVKPEIVGDVHLVIRSKH